MTDQARWRTAFCTLALALVACSDHHEGGAKRDAGGDDQADGGTQGEPAGGRKGKLPADGPSCLLSQVSAEIPVAAVDKVDLLFVVDDSGSMSEEQAALRAQFPRLLTTLASGDRGAGKESFPPARNLHLGVVSIDLGLVGINDIDRCTGLGDDGIMQNEPRLQGCKASYPRFLTFEAGLNTPMEAASDLACIAELGTEGCGFEQQLESALKALWPGADNRVQFVGDPNGFGKLGHGDNENQGFLRNDPAKGLSVIAIVLVTDEEDCSHQNSTFLTPSAFLNPTDPVDAKLLKQGLNVRCSFNQQDLFPPARYVNALKALRPGNENLVVFGAIVGVPPETVSAQVLSNLDPRDPAAREQFYQGILSHPLMQPVVDTRNTPDPADDAMRPSCNTAQGVAFPPTRIVEVARGFGENGIVHSICEADLSPAIDAIVDRIAAQLGASCLPRPLVRDSAGLVGCDLVWELPAPGMAASGTPTQCAEPGFPFLLPVAAGQETTTARGGKRCKVAQLAVRDAQPVPTEDESVQLTLSDGWYYDDFSEDVAKGCKTVPQQRIAFTASANPPTGVSVRLECSSEVIPIQPLVNALPDQPSAGDPCAEVIINGSIQSGDAACLVRRQSGQTDDRMFCHPQLNACVTSCETDGDCPELWSCDDSPATLAASGGRAHCNASCSAGKRSADASRVGDPCLTHAVPEGGFDLRSAFIETNTTDCGGGLCIVHGLEGDPREGCVPDAMRRCSTPEEVERSVYCTCRCAAPDGYAQCACPDGFSCVTELTLGSPDVLGGYCVRDQTSARVGPSGSR